MKKRRTLEDWKGVVQVAVSGLTEISISALRKLIRKSISERFGRRASGQEVDGVISKLEKAGIAVKIVKPSLEIGKWNNAADIKFYKIDESKIDLFGQELVEIVTNKIDEPQPKSSVEFFLKLDTLDRSLVNEELCSRILEFPDFGIMALELNVPKDREKIASLYGMLEHLKNLRIGMSLTKETNPRIQSIIDNVNSQ